MATRTKAQLDRRRSRVALVSVATAAALIVAKLITAVLTGSVAVLASLVDSTLDLVASSTNFLAIRQAEVPPDHNHRWGHGKAESLSSLAQAALVLISAGALIWQAVTRFLHPQALDHIDVGVVVLIASSVVSIFLTRYLKRSADRHGSIALRADALHYLSDVMTNLAAAVALIAFAFLGWRWLDPLVSLIIAVILGHSALGITFGAVNELMDHELSDELVDKIRNVALGASPDAFGVHELRTRQSGKTIVVDLHLEVRASLTFAAAHEVTVRVQRAIEEALGESIVNIHADPYSAPGEPLGDDACQHVT